MVRRCEGATVRRCACALIMLALAPLAAQTPEPKPSFEVATVKRNAGGAGNIGFNTSPSRFAVTNVPLTLIIRQAYRVQDYEIIGGPDWIKSERWDVLAKVPEGPPNPERTSAMIQSLLADRFKFVAHTEKRELPIYVLSFARGDGRLGDRLRRVDIDCAAIMKARPPNTPFTPPKPGEVPECGAFMMMGSTGAALRGGGLLFPDLVRTFAQFLNRPVVDKTGLTGAFNIDLTFAPDRSLLPGFGPVSGPPPGLGAGDQPITDMPSLFTAMQEQLGLKLDAQRGPVDVLVIDSVERPTED
jgi:uncharacterized protein (TIGR03435 family)